MDTQFNRTVIFLVTFIVAAVAMIPAQTNFFAAFLVVAAAANVLAGIVSVQSYKTLVIQTKVSAVLILTALAITL